MNNAKQIRRDLISRVAKLLEERTLVEKIDRLPLEMRPRNQKAIRCCCHKERAVLKYRTMALLGFNTTDETDELMPLSEYAKQAEKRTRDQYTPVQLTVVDEACSSCVRNNYIVSNLCRACVARPCMYACKKDAITVTDKAFIDHDKCVNCGMCKEACPFHAIIYQPIPCEESCPVGAIKRNENGIEYIDDSKCIYCGKCMVACPFGAIMEKSFLVEIINSIKEGKKVVAMVAPALAGQFQVGMGQMMAAIKQLGFYDVVEVAKGANETTENEAKEFIERMEEGEPFMTTSCCPAWVNLVNKHMPEMKPFVSDTPSPMVYTARSVKAAMPEAITVFVAPCVGKRSEVYRTPEVDYVVSFEEIGSWLMARNIDVMKCEAAEIDTTINSDGRRFAYSNGVTMSVKNYVENPEVIKDIVISGLDKAAIRTLKGYVKSCPGNFVEVMSCPGGCVNGCDVIANPRVATRQVDNFAKSMESGENK